MNEYEKRICIEITKELMKFPGSALFKDPVSKTDPDFNDYYRQIKNPQDLKGILEKLDNNMYQKVQDWEKDIVQIWKNADQYHGKEHYVTKLAKHMIDKHFNSLKKRISMAKISGWMKSLYIWRDKLDKMLSTPPNSKLQFIPEIPPKKTVFNQFSARDIDALVQASRNFSSPKDLIQITKILHNDSKCTFDSKEVKINIDLLEPKTMHSLRDYYKKQYEAQDKKYPS